MDQNNNGYFPQGNQQQYPQQYPQQAPQQVPQQGYNYGAQQQVPQQVPQQGYNYGAPQQVPQQMNYGGGYGYAPVPQQSSSNGKTIGIIAGVVGGVVVLGLIIFFLFSSSSLDSKLVGKWTCGNESINFKSDHTFDLYEGDTLYYSGKWSIDSDKTLTLNASSVNSTVSFTWCEPGQTSSGGYTWYLSGSTLNVSGDTYTKS